MHKNLCRNLHIQVVGDRGRVDLPLEYYKYRMRGPDLEIFCPACSTPGHSNLISSDCPYSVEEQAVVRSMIHGGMQPPMPGLLPQLWECGIGRPPVEQLWRVQRFTWEELVCIWGKELELRRYYKTNQMDEILEYVQGPEEVPPHAWTNPVNIPPGVGNRLRPLKLRQ